MLNSPGTDCLVELDRTVTMRDGVELAADIYRPHDLEPHPVILHRTPYSKRGSTAILDPVVAARAGYVFVRQETRGRGASEGTFRPFHDEQTDGYDTVEWAAAQPWSSGAVGIFGESAVGANAVQTALAAPPHLRCLAGVHTGFNPYSGWVYSGGALELAFLHGWVRRFAMSAPEALSRPSELVRELRVWADAPLDVLGRLPLNSAVSADLAPYFHEWLEHPTYDDYWSGLDAISHVDRITVPVLHVAGWYDGFLLSHLDFQRALQAHPDRLVREESRLIVGPWDHDSFLSPLTSSFAGDRDFGSAATTGRSVLEPELLRWFDRWLREDAAEDRQPPVRYFVMGDRRWAEASSWPPPGSELTLYLDSSGGANTRNGDGKLVLDPPGDGPSDTYSYDPADPTPTTGGRHLGTGLAPVGVRDQSDVEDREDVLVYVGQPLDDAVSIAGRVLVELFATTSAEDTDFCAKLVDVEPDGYRANIADGIVRVSWHRGAEARVAPGGVLELTIDCWDTAHTFCAGHRIGLEIASANFPRHDRHLNTSTPAAEASRDDAVVAVQQVHHDTRRPSRLVLPVSPAGG